MDLEQAIEIIREWAATKRCVAAVYVFGSRVHGTHRPDSDLEHFVIIRGHILLLRSNFDILLA